MAHSNAINRRGLAVNAAANWFGFAVSLLVTFFMAPRLVHSLGDRAYGVWALVESVLAYLALFDLGIGAAVVRYVARFNQTRERGELNRVFSTSLVIFAALGAMAMLIALVLAFGYVGRLDLPQELAQASRWLMILLGLNLAIGLPLSVHDSVLCALGQYPVRTAVQLLVLGLRTATLLVVLAQQGGLVEVGLVITGFGLLQQVLLVIVAHRRLPELQFSLALVDRGTLSRIRGYSLWAFIALIAGKISFSTDAIVIGAYLTPEAITYFAIAARLTEYAKAGFRSATTVLTPAVSSLDAEGNKDKIRTLLLSGSRYVVWLVLPIQMSLMVLGYPFLVLWMGPAIAESSFVTLLILAMPLTLALSQSVTGRILYGMEHLRWFAVMTIIEALANLVLSIALVRPYGIAGVALATTGPNLVFNAALVAYICRLLDVRLVDYLTQAFVTPALGAGAAWLLWAVWQNVLGVPTTWAMLFAAGASGLAAHALVACFFERDLREIIRRRVALAARPLSAPDASRTI